MKARKSVPRVSSVQRKQLLLSLQNSVVHPDAGSSKQTQHKVVVDTSTLISAIFFGGQAREILVHISERQQMIVSAEIISEFIAFAKLTDPKTPLRTLRLMRQTLELFSQDYDATEPVSIRDINDVHVVQLARTCEAFIVASDHDLLEHKSDSAVVILSVTEYRELFSL